MPKISVIIPVYGVEGYLGKCLDSVINQTYEDLEIICVNDCSPDNSAQILEEYAKKDNRIKIVNREKNGGLSAARNTGMDNAGGKYFYFLDSDDWIDLDYIEKIVEAAEKNNVPIVVNTNILAEYPDRTERFNWNPYPKAPDNGEILSKDQSIGVTPCMTWTHLYEKSHIDKYTLRFPEGYIHEDNYFHYVSEVWADRIFAFEGAAYHYLQRDNGIMNSRTDKTMPRLKIMNLILDYFEENNLKNDSILKVWDFINFEPITTEPSYLLLKSTTKRVYKFINETSGHNDFLNFAMMLILKTNSIEEYQKLHRQDLRLEYLRTKVRLARAKN